MAEPTLCLTLEQLRANRFVLFPWEFVLTDLGRPVTVLYRCEADHFTPWPVFVKTNAELEAFLDRIEARPRAFCAACSRINPYLSPEDAARLEAAAAPPADGDP